MEKKHTFAVLSFARQCQHRKDGEVYVFVRITVNSKRSEISTKTIIPREKWIPGKGKRD